jgi:hypothetical protein
MKNETSFVSDLKPTSSLISSLFDPILNLIFSPKPKSGNFRYGFFQFLLFFTWTICAFTFHKPGEIDYPWLDFLYTIPYPIMGTLKSIIELFLALDVLLVMFSLVMGYIVALKITSIYLADLFDIKDNSISEKYLKQSAFSFPGYYQIHVENAQIRPEDQKSPISKIGGPGKVLINLENAVVFEKIDGIPRVEGPSFEKPVELESFERIRKIIDLRDQTATLDISTRTLDGIPIEIKDIRIIFSVLRTSNRHSLENPYSFREDAINWLVFQQGPGPWTTSLINQVRTELTEFINNHLLSELLSSVGTPEINQQIQNQIKIYKNIRRNWSHTRRYKIDRNFVRIRKTNAPNYKPIYYRKKHHKLKRLPIIYFSNKRIVPEFVPRKAISNLFYENIANSFQSKIQKYGMRLEWINVGTWHSSSRIIPEQHMKAWQISSENAIKLNSKVLTSIFNNAKNQYLEKNIQSLPIISFIQKRENGLSSKVLIDELINEYSSKLTSARDLFIKSKGRVPVQIERALSHIKKYRIDQLKDQALFIGENNSDQLLED